MNEVFISLQDKHDLQLSFNDALLSKCEVSDSAEYESIDELINSLIKECGFAFKKVDDVYIIYDASNSQKSTTFRFSGKVIDQESKESLPYTQVVMDDIRFVTDQNGNFAYQSKDSIIQLKMNYMGYRFLDTILTAGLQQTIVMQPSIMNLEEVVINYKKRDQDSILVKPKSKDVSDISNTTGLIKLNHEVATFLPGNNSNTIFNLLRLQPGVLAAGEQTDDYLIWGSQKGQTQIIFDGITMFNIGSYNDNVGAINPLMVKDIEVLKAGYNVHVGDRVGGVVNITGKTGNAEQITGNLQMNQLISSANINIPIDDKYALQAATRFSYYDLLPAPSIEPTTERKFSSFETESTFKDYNLKFSGKEKNGDEYYISTLKNKDEQNSIIEDVNGKEIIIRNRNEISEQNGAAAFYGKTWEKYGVTNSTLAYSSLKKNSETTFEGGQPQQPPPPGDPNRPPNSLNPPPEQSNTQTINSISELSLKVNHTLPVIKGNQIRIGVGVIKNTSSLEGDNKLNYDETSTRINTYLKDDISVTKRLSVEPGLRLDYSIPISKSYFQPRLKASYNINKFVTLNVATGLYNQFIVQNLVRGPEGNNFYQWEIANDSSTSVLQSWHYVGGLSTLYKGFKFKIEGFYKLTSGLTRLINDGQNGQTILNGEGKSYGVDFYLEKKVKRHIFWASYTYSVSEERFDETIDYRPSAQDQRHEIKGAALLNFNPIYVSTNYVFGSGLPTIEPGRPPSDVLTPYNRWDIAISYKVKKDNTKIETGVSIVNVLNTENIRYNDFLNRTDGKTFYSKAMPFTPSFFLNIGF